MNFGMIVVFGLIVGAAALFASERLSFDVTALMVMAILMLTGVLTPRQGLSGFSNPATITIAAMFIVSEGVRRTGGLRHVADFFSGLAGKERRLPVMVGLILTIGIISAFINNTAAVAMFLPVVIAMAPRLETSASKLLMPMSFMSMFGGVCTLVGTSTNILVSSIARDRGLAGFGMFEFAPLGLVFLVAGGLYLLLGGHRLVPARRGQDDLTSQYELSGFLTEVVVEPDFEGIGEKIAEDELFEDLDLDLLQVFKREDDDGDDDGDSERETPTKARVIEAGDVLRLRGGPQAIGELLERKHLTLEPTRHWQDFDLEFDRHCLVEAVVAPDSDLASRAIGDIDFPERFGAVVLAVRRSGDVRQEDMGQLTVRGGDALLLMMDPEQVPDIEREPSFVLASQIGVPQYRTSRLPLALAILAAVIGSAALGVLPIVVSAVAGAVLLVVTGCLTTEEARNAVNWKVILLLGGVLPLGLAMDKTGAAEALSNLVLHSLEAFGARAIMAGFFGLTMALTAIVSNQATAALLAPIAIQAAQSLGVSPHPFLMAITYAASLSLVTPVGYQTNTLIYGPGHYRFTDFTRVGAPLNLIFWLLATWLIPVFWPF